ncbi:hypothetical protein [Streptomyces sp. NBC_00273]|uniref:hypothetical protein n=1 Tax=Streptomyces sp. NBC_00273 TaxID=2903644 RepID=UPI002E29C15A|nr:hypothetical protein [Streptomyces sp. NBC_00273]
MLIRRGEDLIMAVVGTCTYDSRGKLVHPETLDISRAKIRPDLDTGEKPTFDRGHTHVLVVSPARSSTSSKQTSDPVAAVPRPPCGIGARLKRSRP